MDENRQAILSTLKERPASGPELATRLGMTRAGVWKHIEALRAAGFEVDSTNGGYELGNEPPFNGIAVESGLEAPFEVEFHASIDSTNDRARDLAREGHRDIVVLADEQTGGRGRLDRAWTSPSGGIWMSVLTAPALQPDEIGLVTLAAGVATCRACREAGVPAQIKWPNDIILSDDDGERYQKVAGILTEMEAEMNRVSWVIIGIGINANIPETEMPETGISLQSEVGPIDRVAFTQRVLESLDALLQAPDGILAAWRELAVTPGQRVRVETPTRTVIGEAIDIVAPGALVVETDDGERVHVHAGDCEHLRPVA